ncbi:hypothetical protein [Polaribacter uvawellassae]|uniref:hypothetical protein n=1 Tax=Polaribacter uvawellassae TaxID=3133495 RepID=UPI00321B5913
MKKILLIVCCVISCQAYSQENNTENYNPRTNHPFGLNLNFFGPSILGLSADYYVNPKTNIELGIGLFGLFGGGTYHFKESNNYKWTTYVGLFAQHVFEIGFSNENSTNDDIRNGIYIPLGLQYLNEDGITFRIELATGTIIKLYGGLKFGYHF